MAYSTHLLLALQPLACQHHFLVILYGFVINFCKHPVSSCSPPVIWFLNTPCPSLGCSTVFFTLSSHAIEGLIAVKLWFHHVLWCFRHRAVDLCVIFVKTPQWVWGLELDLFSQNPLCFSVFITSLFQHVGDLIMVVNPFFCQVSFNIFSLILNVVNLTIIERGGATGGALDPSEHVLFQFLCQMMSECLICLWIDFLWRPG